MSTSDKLYAALAEVLHYVNLRWALPSDQQPITPTLRHAELAALRIGLAELIETGYAVTEMGASWLAAWGQPELEAVEVAA